LLLLSAFAVGIAEATRDMAVEYAKTREQFGRPIGSFQAIKHICADMAIRCEAAACQTAFASLVLAEGHAGLAFHATSSKLVAAASAIKNASQNIQVHGAIGFTAEADPHLFLKRAHVIEQLWGDTRRCRERLLSLDLPE
jgi:alkylation response protein AidB-like acyl-CoA dehydrogenase